MYLAPMATRCHCIGPYIHLTHISIPIIKNSFRIWDTCTRCISYVNIDTVYVNVPSARLDIIWVDYNKLIPNKCSGIIVFNLLKMPLI